MKHSAATEAEVSIVIEHSWFELTIADNGKGFDVEKEINSLDNLGGNGLISIKRGAQTLGGELEIDSKIGKGTKTVLRVLISIMRRLVLTK